MSTNPNVSPLYSPGMLSFIPLLYAAWADRVLSPTEIQLLREQGTQCDFLSKTDKEILLSLSNPVHPPSTQLFKYWEIQMRQAAKEMNGEATHSLVDLGLFMAAQAGVQTGAASPDWNSLEIRKQLESFEERLRQISLQAYHNIFPDYESDNYQKQFTGPVSFDPEAMANLLDDDYPRSANVCGPLFRDPVFNYQVLPEKEAYRKQVLEWCTQLAEQGFGAYAFPKEFGGMGDMGRYAAVFEMLGYHDLSLAIKFGVQFGLFGGSIQWLGTPQHHQQYLEKVGTLELPGCFAMTETGHGSNVRGLETTATYDPKKDVFIVHTPNREAGKEYIGNALHGRMATVFAQLLVNGENHGVHALLVPLRDEDHQLLPGIEVEDCGYKMGLNGVDNGRIWFSNVVVPRENLLNRFGNVDETGAYSSPIENPSRRFFTMLGTLVGGRVCVPRAGLSATKSALTIAIRYALKRRQFGPSVREPETLLLDYPSHQRRLIPALANAYALDFALTYLTRRYIKQF